TLEISTEIILSTAFRAILPFYATAKQPERQVVFHFSYKLPFRIVGEGLAPPAEKGFVIFGFPNRK
ncbi:MAG: hypothetical protein IIX49_07450, partial [Oscillospiraceae bacterium]|nr:hypothetical protein [Oscillospiraceae bacterium]